MPSMPGMAPRIFSAEKMSSGAMQSSRVNSPCSRPYISKSVPDCRHERLEQCRAPPTRSKASTSTAVDVLASTAVGEHVNSSRRRRDWGHGLKWPWSRTKPLGTKPGNQRGGMTRSVLMGACCHKWQEPGRREATSKQCRAISDAVANLLCPDESTHVRRCAQVPRNVAY